MLRWSVILCITLPHAVNAARGRIVREQRSVDALKNEGADALNNEGADLLKNEGAGALKSEGADTSYSALNAAIGSLVSEMIDKDGDKGPATKDIVNMAEGKMDLGEAVRELDNKLPSDVAALVRFTTDKSASEPQYDEQSLQKARNILNDMMLAGWQELDEVMFECMGFRQRNRGTYDQVVADLARLGSQVAKLAELKTKSSEGIAESDRERKSAEETLRTLTQEFKTTRLENQNEMTMRKNDLAVFDFVLNLTSCDYGTTGASMLELAAFPAQTKAKVLICDTKQGFDVRFENPQLQAQVERMMTPDAKRALREALGQVARTPSLLQVLGQFNISTTTNFPPIEIDPLPVSEEPHPAGQWKKCVDGPVDCGLLHDLMSLEWGKFRDSFDELTAEMNENQDNYDSSKSNLNDELTVINNEKTKHMESLANAISDYNADTEETSEKEEQKRQLTTEFDKKCAEFKAKITEILHTKICAVRKVRNELMRYSRTTPPEVISDCDFTDWHSKTGECVQTSGKVILCDDTCNVDVPYDEYDPYQCGGLETMKRDVVVSSNEYGMVCPPHLLERKRRCGQKLCPVDCSISQWSGWSKCSKDCESGIQARTRSILTKPKNGGTICDSAQEARSCNTGSCDRDCTLEDWTDWMPCSMACGGGFTTHVRKVLVPIRGQGKCPSETSIERWEEDQCNTHDCTGDEICIARQDLIIALDASGSLKLEGFDILRNFAVNLTQKYRAEYFGQDTMRIGLALFGNGALVTQPDGSTTISPAILVEPLTDNFDELRAKMSALTWQRGFTNMAQVLTLADVMLTQKGRADSQSAILVLSDGKYSFKYQTAERAQELKDKNIQLFMAPVTDFEDKDLDTLKEWASQPWQTNYEHLPGLAALKNNADIFAQKLVVKFCPDSLSPSLLRDKEDDRQYMLIHEGGTPDNNCGRWFFEERADNVDQCAAAAVTRGLLAFSYGHGEAAGECHTESIPVTLELWNIWKVDRTHPACVGGTWTSNPFMDTYAIHPTI